MGHESKSSGPNEGQEHRGTQSPLAAGLLGRVRNVLSDKQVLSMSSPAIPRSQLPQRGH